MKISFLSIILCKITILWENIRVLHFFFKAMAICICRQATSLNVTRQDVSHRNGHRNGNIFLKHISCSPTSHDGGRIATSKNNFSLQQLLLELLLPPRIVFANKRITAKKRQMNTSRFGRKNKIIHPLLNFSSKLLLVL